MTIHRGWYRGASLVFTTVPFAFGVTRATQTGTDYRYVWLAIASFLGATAVMMGVKASVVVRFVLAMLVAVLMAGLVAILFLSTKSGPGVWIVTLGFGFCSASGAAFSELRNSGNNGN